MKTAFLLGALVGAAGLGALIHHDGVLAVVIRELVEPKPVACANCAEAGEPGVVAP